MTTERLDTAFVISGRLIFPSAGVGPVPRPADADSPGWVGSWIAHVCVASPDPRPLTTPDIKLVSLTKDGTSIIADFGHPAHSPGLGVWAKTGHNRFAVTLVELLSNTQGALAGRTKVRAALEFDAVSDSWSGPFRVDITDPTGQCVLDLFEGTVHATRMQVEALP